MKSVTSLENSSKRMKISMAPEGHFFLENMNTKELNESDGHLNFTVTYCGADVPLNPFVTLESMEENLNATANVKDKVLVCDHGFY